MSFTKDILTGFAVLLSSASIGLTWRPDGTAYAAGETGILLRAVPPEPDRIVTLSTYGLGDEATYADSTVGLQVRTRSGSPDPTDVDSMDDAIADVLLGNYPLTLSTGVRIVTLIRSSTVSLGQDDSKRWGQSSNYTLGLYRPGPHRL